MTTDFLNLVLQMRTAQKDYYTARKNGTGKKICDELLVKSKSLESMVDKTLAAEMSKPKTRNYTQGEIDYLAQ